MSSICIISYGLVRLRTLSHLKLMQTEPISKITNEDKALMKQDLRFGLVWAGWAVYFLYFFEYHLGVPPFNLDWQKRQKFVLETFTFLNYNSVLAKM